MSQESKNQPEIGEVRQGSLTTYIIGFVLSLALTLTAYLLAWRHVHSHHEQFSHRSLVILIIMLAVTQLLVQLAFFLHLSSESKPRWNLLVFLFALMVLLILVPGSLWIMNNLNYHGRSPQQTDTYIIKDEGVHHH